MKSKIMLLASFAVLLGGKIYSSCPSGQFATYMSGNLFCCPNGSTGELINRVPSCTMSACPSGSTLIAGNCEQSLCATGLTFNSTTGKCTAPAACSISFRSDGKCISRANPAAR